MKEEYRDPRFVSRIFTVGRETSRSNEKKKAVNVVETTRYVNSRVARANLPVIILCNNIPRYREKRAGEGEGRKVIARSFLFGSIYPANQLLRTNRCSDKSGEKKGEESEVRTKASIHEVENRLLSRRFDDTHEGEKIPTILTLGSFSGAIDPRPVSILIGIESQLPKITRLFSPATGVYGDQCLPTTPRHDKVLMTGVVGSLSLSLSLSGSARAVSIYRALRYAASTEACWRNIISSWQWRRLRLLTGEASSLPPP